MRITWANHSKRWILVSNVSMTYHGFSESNTSDWFQYVWALPQNRWRIRRLHIFSYAHQLSCNFQHSRCTFVTILFRLLARLFINLARALFSKSASMFGLVQQAFWRCHFSQNGCKFLWGNPYGSRAIFPLGLLPRGLLVLDAFFTLCCMKELGEGFNCVFFARLLISWRKLQLSPLEHCPLAYHCQQSRRFLCSRCCVPWFLTTALVS